MKAHSPILREFALTERKRGAKISEISARLRLPSGTVKAWLFRGHATSRATITTGGKATGHATGHATGQWMQSLHHESAHFIVNSLPACSNADNGAKIVPGMAWLPHDGCVRKCLRCMKKVENDTIEKDPQHFQTALDRIRSEVQSDLL